MSCDYDEHFKLLILPPKLSLNAPFDFYTSHVFRYLPYHATSLLLFCCPYLLNRFERFVDTLTEEETDRITREKEEKEEVKH